jgi:hypothetical protein
MQWLMIALLGSLFALLLAAAGVVHHIRRPRARLHAPEPAEVIGSAEEAGLESNYKVDS